MNFQTPFRCVIFIMLGCSSLLTPAHAFQEHRILVPTNTLTTTHRLVGPLGLPLGHALIVEGVFHRIKSKAKTYTFQVKKVNDKRLRKTIQMNYNWWKPNRSKNISLAKGKRYRFLAYQHGEMQGTPHLMMKELGSYWQTYGYHFRTALILMKRLKQSKFAMPPRPAQAKKAARVSIPSTKLNKQYALVVSGANHLLGVPLTATGALIKCKNPSKVHPEFQIKYTRPKTVRCFRVTHIKGKKLSSSIIYPLYLGVRKLSLPNTRIHLRAYLDGGMVNGPTLRAGSISYSPKAYRFQPLLVGYQLVKGPTQKKRK